MSTGEFTVLAHVDVLMQQCLLNAFDGTVALSDPVKVSLNATVPVRSGQVRSGQPVT